MEFKNYKHPGKCYACKEEDTKKDIGLCDKCRKRLIDSKRILCIGAELEKDGQFTLSGKFFTIHEEDFISIMGIKERTLQSRFCFINKAVFDALVNKAKNLEHIQQEGGK